MNPPLTYQDVDQALINALPELLVAYTRCVEPGEEEHPGQYPVFDLFADFIEVLLALPTSPTRDELLLRAFAFVELMQQSADRDVRDLANIAIYEGRSSWWFARAHAFIGPESQAFLTMYEPEWCQNRPAQALPDPEREIIDSYGVRDVVFQALRHEGAALTAIPGVSALERWRRLASLEQAQQHPDGAIFLSCWGTSEPYVIAPAADVRCEEATLAQLARDLADIDNQEPDRWEGRLQGGQSYCYAILVGERVADMRVGDMEHGRYRGTLWIAPTLIAKGLEAPIKRVLAGQQRRLQHVSGASS